MIFGDLHEWSPGGEKTRPVVVDHRVPVAADKRVDLAEAEEWGGLDHAAQVGDCGGGHRRIRIEGVGVVAESAEGDTVANARRADVVGPRRREVRDIDVRDTGVFAIRRSDRPAHRLDTGKPLGSGEGEHVVEREFRENGGDESEMHEVLRGKGTSGANSCFCLSRFASEPSRRRQPRIHSWYSGPWPLGHRPKGVLAVASAAEIFEEHVEVGDGHVGGEFAAVERDREGSGEIDELW